MKKRFSVMVRAMRLLAVVGSVFLIILGAAEMLLDGGPNVIGVFGCAAGAVIFVISLWVGRRRSKRITNYMQEIEEADSATADSVYKTFPLPMAALHVDGSILWCSEKFCEMAKTHDVKGGSVTKLLPGIKWNNILKSADGIDFELQLGENTYNVVGSIVRTEEHQPQEDNYEIYLYFIDKTSEKKIYERYKSESTGIGVICIDNYDEILQRLDDSQYQQVLYSINQKIREWASDKRCILKKTERDRYLLIFESGVLQSFIDDKFSVLEQVRRVGDMYQIPSTISIGIGVGARIWENDASARNALEMALGRGGDQAAVKDETQYKFYGGKTKEYEKSTRVKTRAFATALRDFILKSDSVFLMGHKNADYDSFGAAMGMQRAARALGKRPYIILDSSPAVKPMMDIISEHEEYDGMFINEDEALESFTQDSLLVVLDTHRPSMLPALKVLSRAKSIILIDHHRRSTEFLPKVSLVYHEPYASSTCEMVTEILEYIDDRVRPTALESECLYTGILMDTKNFLIKTGVRTFEAASYLRRCGLDTISVKRMFNIDKADYAHKAEIVKNARRLADKIAVSVCGESFPNIRVISSQAADEMLNLENFEAAFVIYPMDGDIGISARSIGKINVQLIMEALGGGGHMTIAGAQLKNDNAESALRRLTAAVNEYLENK